jgi:hypothetical protein
MTFGAMHHGEDGPTDLPIRAIHRGSSGYIPLVVKKDGIEWQQLGAMQVGQPFLPSLLAQLANDGYFALNTSYGTRPRPQRVTKETWQPIEGQPGGEQLVLTERTRLSRINPRTKLPWPNHSAETLRWFDVAYVDIDFYKLGLTLGDAIGAIVDLQDAGELPPASMFLRSGRGLWALWFLVDHQNPTSGEKVIYDQTHWPWTSARVTRRTAPLYAKVQNAIVRKLSHLGADLMAADSARYCPVPGTQKTGATERVLYWVQSTGTGPALYTLMQLATGLKVELQIREHPVIEAALRAEPEGTKNPKRQAAGVKGWIVRWEGVVYDLEILKRLREGRWDTASRNLFAFYYAAACYRAGMSKADVEARIYTFAARVNLTNPEAAHALKQAFRKPGTGPKEVRFSHLRRQTYLDALGVTPAERYHLDIGRKPEPAPTAGKASIQGRRDAIMDAITANGGKVPSVRRMADVLAEAGVPCGNHSTVHRDYLVLGLKPTTKAGRPPKLPL